ncbi:xanthine dehydrogenase subunit XdhC [Enterococcus rivorum]|uniref:(2Fe-2S)-binding protein n=1 Tax=Enterococcus rivorum TaxID=762845 RepID=A0A1E5KSF3_9ENTE|nr:xanthine dehydrogenase subunit XdhC [Enterococcus rivorum]MBP2098267.1 carbon-monoxide dehydrogenase small subunit [Enterococcus rivorum]OEH80815.1 (2Fe-2S)-binding protein [Enterococcus rivorum]
MKRQIEFNLNGEKVSIEVDVRKSLLEMLRDDFGLVGSKEGCSVGECGACSVSVDKEVIDSCIYLAVWVDGKNVVSIEGISNEDGSLSDIQKNYVESGAVQCGFCIPGLIVSSTQLLDENSAPTRQEIRRGLAGNLCRCTGYHKIIDAVENTAKERNEKALNSSE